MSKDTCIIMVFEVNSGLMSKDTTFRMISVLRHLKRLKVQLPIEVFHYPDELQDHDQRKEIQGLGATLREIVGVQKEEGAWKVHPQMVCINLADSTELADQRTGHRSIFLPRSPLPRFRQHSPSRPYTPLQRTSIPRTRPSSLLARLIKGPPRERNLAYSGQTLLAAFMDV